MTVVYTANYGAFDTLRPQAEQDIDTEWVAFTDDPGLVAPAPWRVVVESATHPGNPRLSAKRRKMRPPHVANDAVWIDANHEVTSPTFVRQALAARRDGIALFRHPRRDDILNEAHASVGAESQGGKYADEPVIEQAKHYIAGGHPRRSGLYAAGTIAWDLSEPRVLELGRAWWDECTTWSVQDQISFPVVARRMNLTPGTFPVPQLECRGTGWIGNRWLRIWPHLSDGTPLRVMDSSVLGP